MKRMLTVAALIIGVLVPATANATIAVYQNGYIYENVTVPTTPMGYPDRTFNEITLGSTTNGKNWIYYQAYPLCGNDIFNFYGTHSYRPANGCVIDQGARMECGRGASGTHTLVFTTCKTDY